MKILHSRLLELLDYDPISGIFTRKDSCKVTGTLIAKGYIQIRLDSVTYYAHILAWFYVHGVWPVGKIDHKDNVRSHNWILNLREASQKQNNQSAVKSSSNKSGFKGVSFRKNMGRYVATITVDSVQKTLGYSDDPRDAALLYDEAALAHYGAFAKTNKMLGLL